MKKAFHSIISGKVQGVFFRVSVYKQARQLNIKGWIKNKPSGDVEAFFEGKEEALNEILSFCEIGPQSAKVETITVEEQTPQNHTTFRIF